jgi:hypothetical protein
MAGAYRFLFADLVTNAILAELPLVGVSATRTLKGAGTFTAKLALGDPKVTALDWFNATQPARTGLYVDRDGVLVYGGILWTRRKPPTAPGSPVFLELAGSEFWSYYRRRYITSTATFAATDQLTIAQSIMNTAIAVRGGDIGLNVAAPIASGVLRDRTYNYYELKPVAEAVDQLSAVDGGFDFGIDLSYVNGVPTKTLNWNYPRRGASLLSTGIVFEKPGNIVDYSYPEDGTLMADKTTALGAGQGDNMLRSSASITSLIDGGYPLLEATQSYKDVLVQATLDAHARADVTALQSPVTLPEIWVRADQDPVLGSYTPGDDVRVRINDERFPAATATSVDRTLDAYYRLLSMTMTPQENATPESVYLQLGATG